MLFNYTHFYVYEDAKASQNVKIVGVSGFEEMSIPFELNCGVRIHGRRSSALFKLP